MRTIYKKQDGTILEVGDMIDYTFDGETKSYPVSRITNEGFRIRACGGNYDLTHGVIRTRCPGITLVFLPEVGYFDRRTGVPLVEGSVLPGGTVDMIISDALRFARAPGEELHRFIEVDPSIENLEWGVELHIRPTESEVLMGLPRIVTHVDNTRYFVMVDGQQVPVEESVWLNGAYHRISACHILRGLDRRLITDTTNMIRLADGTYGLENECVTLSNGEVVHMLDCVATQDGRIIRSDEAVAVRGANGEPSYYSGRPDGALELGGELCWEEHIVECGETGNTVHISDCVQIGYNNHVSRAWAEQHARTCEECGVWFRVADSVGGECPACRELSRTRIRNYSNRSAAFLPPEKNVPLKFGIELEVGCDRGFPSSTCASVMADALDREVGDVRNYAVFKADGSLCDCNGFEIVTRPDCPSVHKRLWSGVLEDREITKHMSSFNNGKCGIHIHVSREPLSELWVGRLLVLVNDPMMQPLLHKIAGRGPNTYTTYDGRKKLVHGAGRGGSRYEALNTSGDNTIEFRIFRGTLNRASFLKNIEFVEAALAFTRPAERSLREIGRPELFLDFVSKSRKDYPYLFGFLINKGLCNK